MTLLSVVRDCAAMVGIDAPTSVVDNPDRNAVRLLALSNYSGKALARRYAWEALVKEFTLSAIASEDQGTLESIMPGFNWPVYETIWNRSTQFPVQGPLFSTEWQYLEAINMSGPYPQFRIRGGKLLCTPVPTAGDTFAGEYVSRYWCQSSGGSGQERWAADTDTGVLSEDLLTLDLAWRWKRAVGLDYAEEKLDFEVQANEAMARSGSQRTLNLEGGTMDRDYPRGIAVQVGNWPLT